MILWDALPAGDPVICPWAPWEVKAAIRSSIVERIVALLEDGEREAARRELYKELWRQEGTHE